MMRKLALISCYIGKLPWYFHYFVHSCRYNTTVDFYIITDDSTWQKPLPANVKLIPKTLADISRLAESKLGFTVDLRDGYKLCDFKPAYGFIFPDIINGYDFWGHCDIDIIFGNIRAFITDDLLEGSDIISVRHDWLSGCFLLYRNCFKMNTLFMQSKDYGLVLSSSKHYCFDETNFSHDAFSEGIPYTSIATEIESMTHVVKRLEEAHDLKPFFDFLIIEGLPGRLKWEKGSLYYRNRFEALFYHMIYFKKVYRPVKLLANLPEVFRISPSRIY